MDTTSPRKTTRLRDLIRGPQLSFLMEAHHGLSARIAEEAGFPGVWASGLSISASLGVRDNNEASWTQVLDVAEYMSDATRVPILLDGDTGFGNFNSVRRLVRKLEQRGVAGVCLGTSSPQDQQLPKGAAQPGRGGGVLREDPAAKDTQHCPDFVVVARVESFIAGRGLGEAARADAYHRAAPTPSSSTAPGPGRDPAFRGGGRPPPVVIVPTKYYAADPGLPDMGFAVVIWANHLMRSALASMQKTAREIYTRESLHTVEPAVAPLEEVFRLQNAAELERAEKRYLPAQGTPASVPPAVPRQVEAGVNGFLVH